MAAGGVADANSKVNREVFDWWVEHHQPILERMVKGTPYKFQYYGGFALNIALGCKNNIKSKPLLTCYRDGYDDIKIHASDIDAKILGVSPDDESGLLNRILKKGCADDAPGRVEADAMPIYDAIMHRASFMSKTILLGPEQIGNDAPLQYVLGHLFHYKTFPPGGGKPGDHYQLILTALFKDAGTWKAQVLSELTPVAKKPLESDPLFKNTGLIELRSQFLDHQRFLANKLLTSSASANKTRKERVNTRIETIKKKLKTAAEAFNTFKRGGARRRRRGSVKK